MVPQIKNETEDANKTLDQLNRISAKYQPEVKKSVQPIHQSQQAKNSLYSNQDFIQNWYASYYQQYPVAQQSFHQYSDTLGYPTSNACFAPYQQVQHNNDYFPYSHQTYSSAHYQPQVIHYNNVEQANNYSQNFQQADYASASIQNLQHQPKQSSPIYDSMYNSKNMHSAAIRPSHSYKSNRAAPYITNRPAKAQVSCQAPIIAINSKQDIPLSVSPVYNMTKLDFNEQSDDSLNLTENFLSQLHNQTIQSTNSSNASSSSFTLSSTASSA